MDWEVWYWRSLRHRRLRQFIGQGWIGEVLPQRQHEVQQTAKIPKDSSSCPLADSFLAPKVSSLSDSETLSERTSLEDEVIEQQNGRRLEGPAGSAKVTFDKLNPSWVLSVTLVILLYLVVSHWWRSGCFPLRAGLRRSTHSLTPLTGVDSWVSPDCVSSQRFSVIASRRHQLVHSDCVHILVFRKTDVSLAQVLATHYGCRCWQFQPSESKLETCGPQGSASMAGRHLLLNCAQGQSYSFLSPGLQSIHKFTL